MDSKDLDQLASNIGQINALGAELRRWREGYQPSSSNGDAEQRLPIPDSRGIIAVNSVAARGEDQLSFSLLRHFDVGRAQTESGSNDNSAGADLSRATGSTRRGETRSILLLIATTSLLLATVIAVGFFSLHVSRGIRDVHLARTVPPFSTRLPYAALAMLPDPHLTPGKALAVHAATICRPGYARHVRPRGALWRRLKDEAYTRYGLARGHRSMRDSGGRLRPSYEVDHLIPLELGGDPTSILNLWPEPIASARQKDLVVKSTSSVGLQWSDGLE
jgi:hypothetical protein